MGPPASYKVDATNGVRAPVSRLRRLVIITNSLKESSFCSTCSVSLITRTNSIKLGWLVGSQCHGSTGVLQGGRDQVDLIGWQPMPWVDRRPTRWTRPMAFECVVSSQSGFSVSLESDFVSNSTLSVLLPPWFDAVFYCRFVCFFFVRFQPKPSKRCCKRRGFPTRSTTRCSKISTWASDPARRRPSRPPPPPPPRRRPPPQWRRPNRPDSGSKRFHWVSLGFTGFYWVLLGFTESG